MKCVMFRFVDPGLERLIYHRVAFFLILFVLVGCAVPARVSIYAPSGPGTLEGLGCEQVGIKNILRVKVHNNVEVLIRKISLRCL